MKKLIIIPFILLFVLEACDLTKLNKVTKSPTKVPASSLFSKAEVNLGVFEASATSTEGSRASRALFQTMAQQWARTTYNEVANYKFGSFGITNTIWTTIYSDILVNLKKAKELVNKTNSISKGVKSNKLACIQVMEVLTYSMLVNIFGNVPYSQALNPKNPHPVFDDAETIYMDLLSRLNSAIQNFDPTSGGFGTADVIYHGDISKWIKFANSLKMRLAIIIADVNPTKAKKAIEAASPHAFTSNIDNALIKFQTVPPNTNPIWEGLVQSGRHDMLPGQPLVSRMNKLNDPRRSVFFTKHNGKYIGGIYGLVNSFGAYSHFSSRIKAKDRPVILLGYDEVEFIRAEAVARGYNIKGSVASHYKKAIRADMEYWDIPDDKINSYLSQSKVKYATAPGNWRQKIGLQKWFAFYGQGMQAWTEVRRLDTPNLKPSPHAVVDSYVMRLPYPSVEQNLNKANYEKAAEAIGGDKISTKLFWDVK